MAGSSKRQEGRSRADAPARGGRRRRSHRAGGRLPAQQPAIDQPRFGQRDCQACHRLGEHEGRDGPGAGQRHALHRHGCGRGSGVVRSGADRRDRGQLGAGECPSGRRSGSRKAERRGRSVCGHRMIHRRPPTRKPRPTTQTPNRRGDRRQAKPPAHRKTRSKSPASSAAVRTPRSTGPRPSRRTRRRPTGNARPKKPPTTRDRRADPQSRAAIASRIGFGMFVWAAIRAQ